MRTIGMIALSIVGACLVLAAVAMLCWAAMGVADRLLEGPPQKLPLVHADYQSCVPVDPGPLVRPKRPSDHSQAEIV